MSADLNAIKARWAAATPGPWEAGDTWVYTMPVYPDDNRLSSVLGMKFEDPERREQEHARARANAEAIAHAPEDIAALIQVLEEVRAVLGADVGWVESGYAVLDVLERRMGADWLNGRGDS